jgi:DNA adenine methylase
MKSLLTILKLQSNIQLTKYSNKDMKYMGSKSRIAKNILPIILEDRQIGQFYVEPFCGGCNTIDKVTGNRIASDINKYLVSMWIGLQSENSRIYNITKDIYDKARNDFNSGTNSTYDDFLIGWIGWTASFNGRFFDGGYSGTHSNRDYISEQIRNIEKQIPDIKGIHFCHCDYADLAIPNESIIYCDIPYKGTKQYYVSKNFNYDKFWDWAKSQKNSGHTVFVSEYEAPSGIKCVWEKTVTNSLNTKKTYKATEKLFKL